MHRRPCASRCPASGRPACSTCRGQAAQHLPLPARSARRAVGAVRPAVGLGQRPSSRASGPPASTASSSVQPVRVAAGAPPHRARPAAVGTRAVRVHLSQDLGAPRPAPADPGAAGPRRARRTAGPASGRPAPGETAASGGWLVTSSSAGRSARRPARRQIQAGRVEGVQILHHEYRGAGADQRPHGAHGHPQQRARRVPLPRGVRVLRQPGQRVGRARGGRWCRGRPARRPASRTARGRAPGRCRRAPSPARRERVHGRRDQQCSCRCRAGR